MSAKIPGMVQGYHILAYRLLDFGDLDLIFKVTLALCFETQILIEKSLCAHYLLNQWLEFDQTSTDTSIGRGKK